MAINILIVGSGQIGRRHVQSLSFLKIRSNIFVVDPNQSNLNIAKKLFYLNAKLTKHINVSFHLRLKKFQIRISHHQL